MKKVDIMQLIASICLLIRRNFFTYLDNATGCDIIIARGGVFKAKDTKRRENLSPRGSVRTRLG